MLQKPNPKPTSDEKIHLFTKEYINFENGDVSQKTKEIFLVPHEDKIVAIEKDNINNSEYVFELFNSKEAVLDQLYEQGCKEEHDVIDIKVNIEEIKEKVDQSIKDMKEILKEEVKALYKEEKEIEYKDEKSEEDRETETIDEQDLYIDIEK